MSPEQLVKDAYDRGFFVGTARAKNRVALGLPIGYDDKPHEACKHVSAYGLPCFMDPTQHDHEPLT